MKCLTLLALACGISFMLSESAVASTSWQMQIRDKSHLFAEFNADELSNGIYAATTSTFSYSSFQFGGSGWGSHNWVNHNWGNFNWVSHNWGNFNWINFGDSHHRFGDWLEHKHSKWCGHGSGTPEVPIPASVWLFASGLGLLGWIRRRRNDALNHIQG